MGKHYDTIRVFSSQKCQRLQLGLCAFRSLSFHKLQTTCVPFQQQYIPQMLNKQIKCQFSSICSVDRPGLICVFTFPAHSQQHMAHSGDSSGLSARPFSTNIRGFQTFWFVSGTMDREWGRPPPTRLWKKKSQLTC